MEKED